MEQEVTDSVRQLGSTEPAELTVNMERKTGRSMAATYAVAGELQGRENMGRDPKYQRSSTGNRPCTARFVFPGRYGEDQCLAYRSQEA